MKKEISFILLSLCFFLSCKKDLFNEKDPFNERVSGNSSLQKAAVTTHPNIILIVGDDIGHEILKCNGGQSYQTPNLDRMAAHGVRSTQCYASPLCSPSRFMLLTGKYNFRNYTAWGIMDPGQKTIANMLQDAGYKTLAAGKWQFDGGHTSIKTFGFHDYLVWEPYTGKNELNAGSRYKNPNLYQDGAYLTSKQTKGKYGDDMFTDYIMEFLDSNYNKPDPFFIYYPMALAHKPFCPTPDDPEFALWNPDLNISDTSFFPSMIKYMDKKIGIIINKVQALGLANNTLILYVGDNGSPVEIYSMFADYLLRGGKGETTRIGTCVPFIATSPGNFLSGSVNNDLIDFTDFLPTIASLANIPKPLNYGILDGVDFAWQLYGESGTPRSQAFCHFDPHPGHGHVARWAQTIQYKKYDSLTNTNQGNKFYDIISDGPEFHAIPAKSRTPEQKKINKTFDSLFRTMHN